MGNDDDRASDRASRLFDAATLPFEAASVLPDLRDGVRGLVDGTAVDPAAVESAIADVEAPGLSDADVSVTPLDGVDTESLPTADAADTVVETGGDAVAITTETAAAGGEAARVVVESGGQAVAVVVEDGGEAAADATVTALAAALDGL